MDPRSDGGRVVSPPRLAKKSANRTRTIASSIAGVVIVAIVAMAITIGTGLLNSAPDSFSLTTADNRWTTTDGCSFKSDGYHDTTSEICFAPSKDVSNGSISVQVRALSLPSGSSSTPAGYGIVFRHTSTGHYYAFLISSDGHWVLFKVSGSSNSSELKSDTTTNPAIQKGMGVTNTLKVVLNGPSITLLVNGTQVGTTSDATYSSGQTGLVGDANTDVVFTNFQITR
jgi:hypothetical protein